MRSRIGRPCIVCGRRTTSPRSRCARHLNRLAYQDPSFAVAKLEVRARSGGRCEAVLADGSRCPRRAEEFHHVEPLALAPSAAEAVRLNRSSLLLHVCGPHNPRG